MNYRFCKVLSGGGIFLPKEIRESVGLEPLDSVEFSLEKDAIVIRKIDESSWVPDVLPASGDASTVDHQASPVGENSCETKEQGSDSSVRLGSARILGS